MFITSEAETMIKDCNFSFYENIPLDRFLYFAEIIGLHKGKDLDVIYPLIKDCDYILELGSGYGRAINFILEKGFKGRITSLERIHQLIDYQKDRFGDRLDFIETDIREHHCEEKTDAILWLWSGILELTAEEQLASIQHCYECLNEGGQLIIEAPYEDIKKFGDVEEDGHVTFTTEWGTLNAYFTSMKDIEKYTKESGFSRLDHIIYKTDTDLERIVYILKK